MTRADETNEPITLLAVGDLHLGRHPTRVAVGEPALRVAEVWGACVDEAIRRRVDAVVLVGDVVDRANRFYEALGPLIGGLSRLSEAGVEVFAVAGNHDFDVLERAAASTPALRVLGVGGRWEAAELERRGQRVRLLGWSFGTEHMHTSAFETFDAAMWGADGARCVGVVHGDLGAAASAYNPITRADLEASPCGLWLLGHLHAPQHVQLPSGKQALYPGTPQPLHPGEGGVHGPWLVRLGDVVEVSQLPLATVAYREVTVALDGISARAEADAALVAALQRALGELDAEQPGLRAASLRVRLVGETPLHSQLAALAKGAQEELDLSTAERLVTLDRVEVRTRPPVALEELARVDDPPGLLARMLLELDAPELNKKPSAQLDALRRHLTLTANHAVFTALDDAGRWPTPHKADALIRQQLYTLLDALLAPRLEGAS